MEKAGLSIARALIAAGAGTGAVALLNHSDGALPYWIAAIALLLAAGALVNRVWAAGMPIVVVAGFMAYDGITSGAQTEGDTTWWVWLILFLIVALVISMVLLLGVGARRAARAIGDQDGPSRFSPQNDAM
jgi:hypothetical protein